MQKIGVNYDEIFFPATMLKSICILLSSAMTLDYEIWQIDVKNTLFKQINVKNTLFKLS